MTTIHCTIENDPDTGTFVGWVVGFMHAQDSTSEPGFDLVGRCAGHAEVPETNHPANEGTGVWVGLDGAVDGGHGRFLPPLRLADTFFSSFPNPTRIGC